MRPSLTTGGGGDDSSPEMFKKRRTNNWFFLFQLSSAFLKSLRVLLSFTPGFSPVMKDRENHSYRFNGFSVSFAGQVLRSQWPECLEQSSKPLKRFTILFLCLSPG